MECLVRRDAGLATQLPDATPMLNTPVAVNGHQAVGMAPGDKVWPAETDFLKADSQCPAFA